MNNELLAVVNFFFFFRGVSREIIIRAIESALKTATARHLDCNESDIRVSIDRKTLVVNTFRKFIVSDDDVGPTLISLAKARRLKADAAPGDEVEQPIRAESIGRIGAQNARQMIIQNIRKAERDNVVQLFSDRIGEIVSGTVRQVTRRRDIIVDVEGSEAVIPARERIPGEEFDIGENVRAVIQSVRSIEGQNAPAITLSRTSNSFLKALFVLEVSEIADGVVEIMGVARDPGARAKIAVRSHDDKIDPVGSCVGLRGTRVRNVVRELNGEKVDIVRYSDDIRKYAEQALSPAKLASVTIVSEERKELLVLVAPEQLSLAIGRSGQNVRLTTKLIGWKVDIKRSDEVQEQRAAENFQSLVEQQIDLLASQLQCTHDVAAVLVSSGYLTPEGVAEPEVSYLAESTGFSEEFAKELWEAAVAAKAAAAGADADMPPDEPGEGGSEGAQD